MRIENSCVISKTVRSDESISILSPGRTLIIDAKIISKKGSIDILGKNIFFTPKGKLITKTTPILSQHISLDAEEKIYLLPESITHPDPKINGIMIEDKHYLHAATKSLVLLFDKKKLRKTSIKKWLREIRLQKVEDRYDSVLMQYKNFISADDIISLVLAMEILSDQDAVNFAELNLHMLNSLKDLNSILNSSAIRPMVKLNILEIYIPKLSKLEKNVTSKQILSLQQSVIKLLFSITTKRYQIKPNRLPEPKQLIEVISFAKDRIIEYENGLKNELYLNPLLAPLKDCVDIILNYAGFFVQRKIPLEPTSALVDNPGTVLNKKTC